jgi:hypothetical protein
MKRDQRRMSVALGLVVLAGLGAAPRPATARQELPGGPQPLGLQAEITTERGCGDRAIYQPGDVLTARFRVDGAEQADATIDGIFANGESKTLFHGVVPGNQTITQAIAKVGGNAGQRALRLTARAGDRIASATCGFVVQASPIDPPVYPPVNPPANPPDNPAANAPAKPGEIAPFPWHLLGLAIGRIELWHVTPGGDPYGWVPGGAKTSTDGDGNPVITLKPNPGGAGHVQVLRIPFVGMDPSLLHFPLHGAWVNLTASVGNLIGSPNGSLLAPENLPFLVKTLGPGNPLNQGVLVTQKINPWVTIGTIWWGIDGLAGKTTKLTLGANCTDGHAKQEVTLTIK